MYKNSVAHQYKSCTTQSHLNAVIDCNGAVAATAMKLSVRCNMLQSVVEVLVNLICVLVRIKAWQLFTDLGNHLIQYLNRYLQPTTSAQRNYARKNYTQSK